MKNSFLIFFSQRQNQFFCLLMIVTKLDTDTDDSRCRGMGWEGRGGNGWRRKTKKLKKKNKRQANKASPSNSLFFKTKLTTAKIGGEKGNASSKKKLTNKFIVHWQKLFLDCSIAIDIDFGDDDDEAKVENGRKGGKTANGLRVSVRIREKDKSGTRKQNWNAGPKNKSGTEHVSN